MINSWATDNWWSTFGQLMMTVYHIIKSWFVCLFCYLSSQVQRNEKYMINRLLFEDQQLIILWSKVNHLMINCLSDKEWCFFFLWLFVFCFHLLVSLFVYFYLLVGFVLFFVYTGTWMIKNMINSSLSEDQELIKWWSSYEI